MASISRYLSSRLDADGKAEIMLRLTIRRGLQSRLHTTLYIHPSRMKDGKIVMPRVKSADYHEIAQINRQLNDIENMLLNICLTEDIQSLTYEYFTLRAKGFISNYNKVNPGYHGGNITDETFSSKATKKQPKKRDSSPRATVKETIACEAESEDKLSIFDAFKEYMANKKVSEVRKARYKVVYRSLYRFEQYQKMFKGKKFTIGLQAFSVDDAKDFEKFLRDEYEICKKYPTIYAKDPLESESQRKLPMPVQRGDNVIVNLLRCLRAFFHYCMSKSYIMKDPFLGFDGTITERYGTPYYISIEERDIIADYKLKSEALAVQRDIFIFQTLIGCRVSDMIRLTPNDTSVH